MVKNFLPICNIIKIKHFCIVLLIVTFHSSFLHTRSLLVLGAYVSIKSIDCIPLLSLEFTTILLISSVKTLCFSLLNLCCVFNIRLLFFMSSFLSSLELSASILFFLNDLFYFNLSCF